VETDIVVKVPLIRTTAYSFKHKSVESWKGGKLQQLSSSTNDDGEPHQLKTANKGALPVYSLYRTIGLGGDRTLCWQRR
jgi:hypothetical protein